EVGGGGGRGTGGLLAAIERSDALHQASATPSTSGAIGIGASVIVAHAIDIHGVLSTGGERDLEANLVPLVDAGSRSIALNLMISGFEGAARTVGIELPPGRARLGVLGGDGIAGCQRS